MTDKIKKLESLTEDVQPEFPTLSRGGYVEDTVDDWLSNHLREVNEIIKYQNYGVEVVDALEEELGQAQARIHELENDALVAEAGVASTEDTTALREELAAAKARIHELENAPMPDFPTGESETIQTSILLQHATKLGSQYIEKAKADGEQIRKDAEETLVELREEIEDLEAQRFATFTALNDFFSQELTKLRESGVFAQKTETPVEAEAPAEEAAEEESPVAEVAPEKVKGGKSSPKVEPAVIAVEDDEEVLSLGETTDEDDAELETGEIIDEEDDKSEGTSK